MMQFSMLFIITKGVTLKKKTTMKTVRIFRNVFITISLTLFITSCSVHTVHNSSSNSGKIPPGQAKKTSGSKSAKNYAPGQQKKR